MYAVVLLLIVYFAVSAIKIVRLNAEYTDAAAENEALLQKRESLQLKLENINSPDYIESQARSDLKLVKPNELLFVFPEGSYANSSDEKENNVNNSSDDTAGSDEENENAIANSNKTKQ